ncbi:MAG: aminoglycoside phosphotransferase family protein [Oscillospiraceae bacterium]|nr:aminoglycoside phosphotransferase family protein [Oscillospiraceae bacterium]
MIQEGIQLIAEKAREVLGKPADSIRQIENVPYSTVFVVSAGGKQYIAKLYQSREWPEDHKLAYVDRLLTRYRVPHARCLCFDRDDPRFPDGFLLEEFLPGRRPEGSEEFYRKFGELTARFHAVPMRGFGYFGGGDGCYDSFTDFIGDVMDDNAEKAFSLHLPGAETHRKLREDLVHRLSCCDGLPPVLCHGDLSEGNVLQDGGVLTPIDWDDALALPWIFDAARLTYHLMRGYDPDTARRYRDAFLAAHGGGRALYDAAEAPLLAYFKLDFDVFEAERKHDERSRR